MKQIKGNLFNLKSDAICITTNSVVRGDGALVMGAGIALEARKRFPELPRLLGDMVSTKGNHVFALSFPASDVPTQFVFSFPVKDNYKKPAKISLIEQSCKELVSYVDQLKLKKVFLPKPGCGSGRLTWAQVEPILDKYLDDRFIIVDLK